MRKRTEREMTGAERRWLKHKNHAINEFLGKKIESNYVKKYWSWFESYCQFYDERKAEILSGK